MKCAVLFLALAVFTLSNITIIHSGPIAHVNSHVAQAANSAPNPSALYISSNNITNLPAGSTFTLGVQVANASYFFGWDVAVQTDPNLIKPVSVNFTIPPDLFVRNYSITPQVVSECINGQLVSPAGACGSQDRPGVAHLAAIIFPKPSNTTVVAPINGLLFNITYSVVASFGFSPIQLLANATLTNGTIQGIFPSLQGGVYGTTVPYASLSANPVSPSVPEGAISSVNITLTSHYQFTGLVNLTLSIPRFGAKGALGGSLALSSLTVKNGGSNSTKLLLNATNIPQSSRYSVTIMQSSQSPVNTPLPLSVNVAQLPYFQASISPGLIRVHAGLSGNTTVEVLSQVNFQGRVNLALAVPPIQGLTASLADQTLTLSSGGTLFTTIYVTTPLTSQPFLYKINLTATGMGENGPLYATPQTLTIMPPLASLLVHLSPAVVVVIAGSSGSTSINALSVDYFWGFSYVSAIMSGGTVTFDHTSQYIPLPNSASASFTPSGNFSISIAVPSNAIPGNYIVLLTVYSLTTAYQKAVTEQIAVAVTVQAGPSHVSILGLTPPVYFGILGALVVPLAFFSALTLRSRRREEKDETWKQ